MKAEDCRVLVLKKDEQARNVTLLMLQRIGVKANNIFLAENVEEAKDIIGVKEVELILSGIGISEEEGPEFLSWIEKANIRGRIIVIFYSGGDEKYIKQKTKDCRADGYIVLPVNLFEFTEKITKILNWIKRL